MIWKFLKQSVLSPKGLNWVQHLVSRIGLFNCLTLQDVITGILYTNCPLLNYLILIAKLYLWGCRRNQTLPVITAFSSKVKIKYETEKYICVKTNKMDKFNKKWALPLDSVPSRPLYLKRTFLFLYSYFTVKVHSVM